VGAPHLDLSSCDILESLSVRYEGFLTGSRRTVVMFNWLQSLLENDLPSLVDIVLDLQDSVIGPLLWKCLDEALASAPMLKNAHITINYSCTPFIKDRFDNLIFNRIPLLMARGRLTLSNFSGIVCDL